MTDRTPDRLPADWLPEPVAPATGGDAAEWDQRLQRLMSAAEPTLAELARTAAAAAPARGPSPAAPWWAVLAARWKPALSAAALATAVLVAGLRLLPGAATGTATTTSAFTLTAVAGGGEAAALWQGMGATADPALAQIVLQGGSQ